MSEPSQSQTSPRATNKTTGRAEIRQRINDAIDSVPTDQRELWLLREILIELVIVREGK